jgi:hypothetical protein
VAILLLSFLMLPLIPASAQEPQWALFDTRNPPAILLSCPQGRYIGGWTIFRLPNDGSTVFDWFMVTSFLSSQPGVWNNVCAGSDWRNSKHALFMQITTTQQPGTTYIIEYGPTTTYGGTTLGFTVGATISSSPGVNLGLYIEYSIPDVRVLDWTSLEIRNAWWIHDMVPQGVLTYNRVNDNVYTTKPGIVIRAAQGDCLTLNIGYQTSFGHWTGVLPPSWVETFLPTTSDVITNVC